MGIKQGLHSKTGEKGAADPVLTRLAEEDKTAWYKKPNLRLLYILLFPACMGIELTSGFDSQLINALQIVPSWISCKSLRCLVIIASYSHFRRLWTPSGLS
jgi:hypothetical protein